MGVGVKEWTLTTRNFIPCDICSIGLGDFEYHEFRAANECEHRQCIDRWIPVEGQIPFKWTEGEITVTYQEFDENEDLYWVEETFTPKVVCPCCYLKYSKENLSL